MLAKLRQCYVWDLSVLGLPLSADDLQTKNQPTGPGGTEIGQNAGIQTMVAPSLSIYEHRADPWKRAEHQDGSTIYAVSQDSDGTVYKSTNLGQQGTWSEQGAVGESLDHLYRLKATGTLVAVADSGAVYRSTDDGSSWTQTHTLDYNPLEQGITETPSGYLLIGEYTSVSGSGSNTYNIYRSTDDAQSFSSVWSSDSSRGVDVNPGHVHCVVWDDIEQRIIALADYNTPDILISSDEGASFSVLDTADNQLFPNFVAPMFFQDYVAWAYDNNDEDASGYVARMTREDFYGGDWTEDMVERIGQANAKAAYFTVEIDDGVYLQSYASEDINDQNVPDTEEVYVVCDEGFKMAGGFENPFPLGDVGQETSQKVTFPTTPFDAALSKETWVNLSTNGSPQSKSAVPVHVGRQNRLQKVSHASVASHILPNNTLIMGRTSSGSRTAFARVAQNDDVVIENTAAGSAAQWVVTASGTPLVKKNESVLALFDTDKNEMFQQTELNENQLTGHREVDGVSLGNLSPGEHVVDPTNNLLAYRTHDGRLLEWDADREDGTTL